MEVLKDGLNEMIEICDVLDYKVDEALTDFYSRGPPAVEEETAEN